MLMICAHVIGHSTKIILCRMQLLILTPNFRCGGSSDPPYPAIPSPCGGTHNATC